MKNVLIVGASGSIAQVVAGMLQNDLSLNITLFLRNTSKLRGIDTSKFRIVEGDVMDSKKLDEAMIDQDVVYVNLAGNLGQMVNSIVTAMRKSDTKQIIFISSIGIYNSPVNSPIKSYREGADIVEASGLDYTILRPSWFTNDDEIDYELRDKGEPENTGIVSRKSLATVICDIIHNPDKYKNRNINVSKRD